MPQLTGRGQTLYADGFRVVRDEIGPVLKTPKGELLELHQPVYGLGLGRRVWALEVVNLIEAEVVSEPTPRKRLNRKDLIGTRLTGAPIRMDK